MSFIGVMQIEYRGATTTREVKDLHHGYLSEFEKQIRKVESFYTNSRHKIDERTWALEKFSKDWHAGRVSRSSKPQHTERSLQRDSREIDHEYRARLHEIEENRRTEDQLYREALRKVKNQQFKAGQTLKKLEEKRESITRQSETEFQCKMRMYQTELRTKHDIALEKHKKELNKVSKELGIEFDEGLKAINFKSPGALKAMDELKERHLREISVRLEQVKLELEEVIPTQQKKTEDNRDSCSIM